MFPPKFGAGAPPMPALPQAPAPQAGPLAMPQPSMPAPPGPSLIHGSTPGVMGSNTNSLKQSGQSELDAVRNAIGLASASAGPKKPRHTNLGKFLHPRKDGKAHGSDTL